MFEEANCIHWFPVFWSTGTPNGPLSKFRSPQNVHRGRVRKGREKCCLHTKTGPISPESRCIKGPKGEMRSDFPVWNHSWRLFVCLFSVEHWKNYNKLFKFSELLFFFFFKFFQVCFACEQWQFILNSWSPDPQVLSSNLCSTPDTISILPSFSS